MLAGNDFITRAFSMPGEPASSRLDLHKFAAAAMHSLIVRAASAETCRDGPLAQLTELIGQLTQQDARRWLTHPLCFASLHGMSSQNTVLGQWHQSVASPNVVETMPIQSAQALGLGNILLPLLLRDNPDWCGELTLGSDAVGRVRFPHSDWGIALYDLHAGDEAVMAVEPIQLRVTKREATLALKGRSQHPFMTMPRPEMMNLVIGFGGNAIDASQFQLFDPALGVSLQLAAELSKSEPHYEPIRFMDVAGHGEYTRAIISEVLKSIDHCSPTVHGELHRYMHTIREFELLRSRDGVVGSFSDPTLPGVMNVNVSYNEHDQPCLSPFCFTWFGHELGHTKNYLIDTIRYAQGHAFVANHRELSPRIPRYGRALRVRTLIQLPYVHLYEWVMLMDFCVAGLDRLPWEVNEDPVVFGDGIQEEIMEALVLIDDYVELTSAGKCLLARLHELIETANHRWRAMRPRLGAN